MLVRLRNLLQALQEQQVDQWLKINKESIYGTTASPLLIYPGVVNTGKISICTMYLIINKYLENCMYLTNKIKKKPGCFPHCHQKN